MLTPSSASGGKNHQERQPQSLLQSIFHWIEPHLIWNVPSFLEESAPLHMTDECDNDENHKNNDALILSCRCKSHQ